MIPESKGHTFHVYMKKMILGPAKYEKAAQIGWISNIFRIVRAQSAQQSAGIGAQKEF